MTSIFKNKNLDKKIMNDEEYLEFATTLIKDLKKWITYLNRNEDYSVLKDKLNFIEKECEKYILHFNKRWQRYGSVDDWHAHIVKEVVNEFANKGNVSQCYQHLYESKDKSCVK